MTWDETPDDPCGAWYRCRLRPDGLGFYRAEVDQRDPSPRLWALIADHFHTHHPDIAYDRALVDTPAHPRGGGWIASFIPATAQDCAGIACSHCQGRGGLHLRIFFPAPPLGDARRLKHLYRSHPELRAQTRGLNDAEIGDYVDAWDRGLLAERAHQAARTQLAEAARKQVDPDALLVSALQAIMLDRVRRGEGIEAVITRLDHQCQARPSDLLRQVGLHIPSIAQRSATDAPRDFVKLVRTELRLAPRERPKARKRTLYRIWKAIPQATRAEARHTGRAARTGTASPSTTP
jgi:hypothetical protein